MAANPPSEHPEQVPAPPAAGQNGSHPPNETSSGNGIATATATASTATATATATAAAPPTTEPRLPTRKDASLKEFLNKMDDYAPIVRIHPPPSSFLGVLEETVADAGLARGEIRFPRL